MHSPSTHPGIFEPRYKEEWRAYVFAEPELPITLPAWKQYKAMGEAQRYRFNMLRHRQHSALVLAWTPRVLHFQEEITERLDANCNAPAGAKAGLLIDGPGTVGKSTMVKMVAREYEKQLRRMEPELFEDRPGNDFVPVVYISLDDNITPKKLSQAIADYLHIPQHGTQKDIDKRVLDMLKSCGTRLLILDDVHFLDCTKRDGAATNDHVKFLANCSGATIIGTGVDLESSALLDEGTGSVRRKQTAGRFSLQQFTPFSITTKTEALEWIGVVRTLEEALVLFDHEPYSLTRQHWEYLHERTLGRMAPLADLIKRAANRAIRRSLQTGCAEEITTELMDSITLDRWSETEYAELTRARARTAAQRPAARTSGSPATG